LILAVVQRLLRRNDREEVLGDLEEGYRRRRESLGAAKARLWLWRQTLSVPLRLAIYRFAEGVSRRSGARPSCSSQVVRKAGIVPESVVLDHLFRNLRFTCRSIRKRPLFFLIPVLSLSVGIGASTVIFSGANVLLFQGMRGVPNANRMVEIWTGRNGVGFRELNYPDFLDLRDQATGLKEIAGYKYQMLTLSRGDAGERALGLLVSANYFDVLGVRALKGRTFLPEEDRDLGAHPVAVLSHSFWHNRWGADPDVVGSTVYLSRQPYTVVGIAPQDFRSHSSIGNPDVYVPLVQHPSLNQGRNYFEDRNGVWFQVLALLQDGVTVADADIEVATVFQRLSDAYPETNTERTASVTAYGALPSPARGYAGAFLAILMGFAVLLLLITCANVAGMFLARSMARQKEIAIQLAMGSSRGQLLQQLLTESLVVFFVGAIGGVALAVWALGYLSSLTLPGPFPVTLEISSGGGALVFALALALVTGLIFGLLPARQALGLSLVSTLKNEGARPRSSEGRLRRTFVAAQVAASLVLLASAGLLLRALQHSTQIEKGFDATDAYVTFLDLTTEGYTDESGSALQDDILEYFSALPWVESVALSIDLPLDMSTYGSAVVPEGWESLSDREYMSTRYNAVSPEYFSTLRIALVEGRGFEDGDRSGAEEVAVVSRIFARQAWPGESALGRRIDTQRGNVIVVGVVDDVPNALLTENPEPLLYRPLAQAYGDETNLVIRSSADPALIVGGTHGGLRALDPRISLSQVIELEQFTGIGIIPQRIAGSLASSLSIVALLLSTMGVYGVMAFTVAQRRREMGIRMALGAESTRVLRSVVLGAFRLTIAGVITGTVLALAVGVVLRTFLLGVSPQDPIALLGAALAVGGMVLAGALVPACRAARVDPVEALRYE
jgi:predicted permease